jgi:hypothetical protein
MNSVAQLEAKAQSLVAQLPIEELIEQLFKVEQNWEQTRQPEFNTVRVWIINEIEKRHPEAIAVLDAWAENPDGRKYSQVLAQSVIDSLHKNLLNVVGSN